MEDKVNLYRKARNLAFFTIIYNILEGAFSVYFGIEDETIALFGFGIDSFVEVISGLGVYHAISKTEPLKSGANALRFERLALKITGFAFYVLAIGLFLTSFLNIYFGRKPETTLVGIIVSIISIATMAILFRAKVNVGKKLGSDAIVADAHCTRACMYLSLVLLLSSAGYELLGFGFIDSIGAAGIGYHALREGKEALEKARELEEN